MAIAEGFKAAQGTGPLPYDWLDAVAESDDAVDGANVREVELMQIKVNAERELAAILAKYGGR